MRGIWSDTDKPKAPGYYHRMQQLAQKTAKNISGVLAMPVKSNWGPVKEIVEITGETVLKNTFGNSMNFTAYKLGKLALLGEPEKLLLYRLADSTAEKGKATLKNAESSPEDVIEFETLYPSDRKFKLSVSKNIIDVANYDVNLYEESELIAQAEDIGGTLEEILTSINESNIGKYVVGTLKEGATGTLEEVSSVEFTGGNNGNDGITNEDYLDAMEVFETYEIDGFTLDGVSDAALIQSVKTWANKCKKEGLDFLTFTSTNELTLNAANIKSKNYNDPIMQNGFARKLIYDGREYTIAEAMVYVAALALSKNLKGSICNAVTIFTDVQPRLSRTDIESALEAGTIVFTMTSSRKVVIVDDVNTYKNFEKEEDKVLGNIRAIRFINTVHKTCAIKAEDDDIGQVSGDDTGHTIILSGFKNFFDEWKKLGIISGYTVETDEERQNTAETDEYFWKWSADYVNVTKRIYSTGNLAG